MHQVARTERLKPLHKICVPRMVPGVSGAGFSPCASPGCAQLADGPGEEKLVPSRAQLLVGVKPCKASEGTYIKVLGCLA